MKKAGEEEEENNDMHHIHHQQTTHNKEKQQVSLSKRRILAFALIPLVVLAGMIVFLFGPGKTLLIINSSSPLPEVTIEKIEFQEGKIFAFVRNTGPIDVSVAQADINDRIQPAAIEPSKKLPRLAVAKVIVPFSWNTGEPYEVGITTSDGVRFSKKVESAALTPTPNIEQASSFAIIGIYVGLIPVLLGLLWLPFVKRLSTNKYIFFLSMTMGLLVFLGIDALVEANKTAIESIAGVFNGQMLIILTILVSFLTLLYVSQKLIERGDTLSKPTDTLLKASSSSSFSSAAVNMQQHQQQESSKTFTIALMIAVGIGLHNLGEGLAVGAAILLGKIALSTFLIVGFTLHNSTEGLAIVAPIAKRSSKVRILRLIGMGIIAGAPTIAGVWIGGFLYSSLAAIIFLSIGAGAIFQVVFSLGSWLISRSGRIISKNDNNNNNDDNNYYSTAPTAEKIKRSVGRNSIKTSWLSTPFITGFVAGMIIMYATSLLVLS